MAGVAPFDFHLTMTLGYKWYKHISDNTSIYESTNFKFVFKNGYAEMFFSTEN